MSHIGPFSKNTHFPTDFNDFIQQLGDLGATLGPIFGEIVEDDGRKVKHGPQKWHVDVEWHVECISFRFVSGPKGPINRKYTIFPGFLSAPWVATHNENQQVAGK